MKPLFDAAAEPQKGGNNTVGCTNHPRQGRGNAYKHTLHRILTLVNALHRCPYNTQLHQGSSITGTCRQESTYFPYDCQDPFSWHCVVDHGSHNPHRSTTACTKPPPQRSPNQCNQPRTKRATNATIDRYLTKPTHAKQFPRGVTSSPHPVTPHHTISSPSVKLRTHHQHLFRQSGRAGLRRHVKVHP